MVKLPKTNQQLAGMPAGGAESARFKKILSRNVQTSKKGAVEIRGNKQGVIIFKNISSNSQELNNEGHAFGAQNPKMIFRAKGKAQLGSLIHNGPYARKFK